MLCIGNPKTKCVVINCNQVMIESRFKLPKPVLWLTRTLHTHLVMGEALFDIVF